MELGSQDVEGGQHWAVLRILPPLWLCLDVMEPNLCTLTFSSFRVSFFPGELWPLLGNNPDKIISPSASCAQVCLSPECLVSSWGDLMSGLNLSPGL